jgi:hypothetical protein
MTTSAARPIAADVHSVSGECGVRPVDVGSRRCDVVTRWKLGPGV